MTDQIKSALLLGGATVLVLLVFSPGAGGAGMGPDDLP
jgi:hypothetical protein